MKKHLYLLVSLAFIFCITNAQVPRWQWAKSTKGNGNRGYSVSTDANGNSYVTGFFFDPVILFDSITLTNQDVNGYSTDIFIVKFDPSGKVVWAKSAGGNGGDIGLCINTDSQGNSYITGRFSSAVITFDSITLTNANSSTADFFIAKYDSSGKVIWAKRAGGGNSDVGYGISLDAGGNSYVTGYFDSPTIVFGSTILSISGYRNFFIAKYDSSGKEIWAKSANGVNFLISGLGISTDTNGNSYVTGGFSGKSISFDTLTLSNADTTGLYYDIFLVRYDSSGTAIWARSDGGRLDDLASSVSTDLSGSGYLTGYFQSKKIILGANTFLNSNTDTLNFSADIFIMKYDTLGNVVWARTAGGSQQDNGEGVSTDIKGNTYATGWFWSDTITFGGSVLLNKGSANIFIVKYDSSGSVVWAICAGGDNDDEGFAIKADNYDNCFITGEFGSSSVIFDNDTLSNLSSGGFEFFVAKLNSLTSVNQIINSTDFLIYPNPSNGLFNITIDRNIKNGKLTVYNILMKKVYSDSFNGKQKLINCQLEDGVYFLRITDGIETWTRKIIKE